MPVRRGRLPAKQIIGHSPYRMGEDSMGDPKPVHDPPVDVAVIGWYITGGSEAGVDGHAYTVEYDAVVLAPVSLEVSPHDRFVLAGDAYEIVAPAGDWNNGPWWSPDAVQIKCKRVV